MCANLHCWNLHRFPPRALNSQQISCGGDGGYDGGMPARAYAMPGWTAAEYASVPPTASTSRGHLSAVCCSLRHTWQMPRRRALPPKHRLNKDVLTTDQLRSFVTSALRRNAPSYRTQAGPLWHRKCGAGFHNRVHTRGLRVPGVLARKRWNFYTLNLALL